MFLMIIDESTKSLLGQMGWLALRREIDMDFCGREKVTKSLWKFMF
jgi:hypothetical protein